MNLLEIKSDLLARNTLFNLIGQAVPIIIGVITIPFIIKRLGPERFGILSLSWIILGYFTIFDLGLGRATTKYVAEALAKREEDCVPHIVWTAVTVQGIFGIAGTFFMLSISSFLIHNIFKIPLNLVEEAKTVISLMALSIPVALVFRSFLGVLEARQRFDLVNIIKTSASSITFFMPFMGLIAGFNLPVIIMLIISSIFVLLIVLVRINFRIFPNLKKYSASFALFPKLLAYGSWIMVSNIISPILTFLDRFLIVSLLSISAVGYYAAPYEVVTRLSIIPASLSITLFPAFSALKGIMEDEKIKMLFFRSIKYIILALTPIVLILIFFSKEILQTWLGTDFATTSAKVLQVLAIGVLANALAYIPYSLLQGTGRPDITAKFHILELVFYAILAFLLINNLGITGAALAWTLRVSLDLLLLSLASTRIYRLSIKMLNTKEIKLAIVTFFLLTVVIYGAKSLTTRLPLLFQSMLFLTILFLFDFILWKKALDNADKKAIIKLIKFH